MAQAVAAQCVITRTSNNGQWSVTVEITPIAVNAPNNCPWGYNYTVDLAYNVTFSGNPPNSMNTLQGTIGCGNSTQFFNLPNSGGSGVVTTANAWTSQTNCSTITPELLGCNTINLQMQASGMGNQTLSCTVEYEPVPPALSTTAFSGSYCQSQSLNVAYSASGSFEAGNVFTAQLSDASGSFANAVNIGSVQSGNSGTINATLPSPITPGSGYRIRVVSSSPSLDGGDNGSNLTLSGSSTDPSEFGDERWNVFCYNIDSYTSNPNNFNYSNYRGMYTQEGVNFSSSALWPTGGSPSEASNYVGCEVGDNLHIVQYKRRGFPCGTYQINIAGENGERGHDDAAILRIDGQAVWSSTGCCVAVPDVWQGVLDSDSEVEFVWSENWGGSYGRVTFVPLNVNTPEISEAVTVVAGGSATLTATLEGAEDFDWSTNSTWLVQPLNTASVNVDVPADASPGSQTYTVLIVDPTSNCTHELSTTVTVVDGQFTWRGQVSDEWDVAGNWQEGQVPDNGANVTINTSGSNPTISGTVSVNNLLIQSGSSIDFENGFSTLRVAGNFTNNGNFNPRQGKVTFNNSAPRVINGSQIPVFHDLRLDLTSRLTLETDIHLTGAMQPARGIFDWAQQNVVLLSDEELTGSIGEIKNTAEIIGDVITYNRFIPTGPASWRMLCMPLTDITFAEWNDDFPTTGFPGADFANWPSASNPWPSIRWYNEPITGDNMNSGFEAIGNINDALVNGQGYFTYFTPNSTMIDGEGTFKRGNLDWELSYTNSNSDPYQDGWNLLGNPYPSAIDWDSPTGWTKQGIANAVYAYSAQTGQYSTYINGIGIGEFDGKIASGQAFWVKAEQADAAVSINERAKVNTTGVFLKSTSNSMRSLVRVKLTTSNQNIWDEAVIGFHNGATEGFDPSLDAWKFFSNNANLPNLASMPLDTLESRAMAISLLPVPEEDVVVDLFIRQGNQTSFTLTNTLVDTYEDEVCIVLEDRELATKVAFDQGSSYSFEPGEMALAERFALHFSAALDVIVFDESCPNADDGRAIAQGFGEAPWTFTWFDEVGQIIRTTEESTVADVFEDLTPGFYEVQVDNSSEHCSSTFKIVQVKAAPEGGIEIDTHPATCNTLDDGQIAIIADEIYTWSFEANRGGDEAPRVLSEFTGDTLMVGLPAGWYNITAVNNCGNEISLGPVDLHDPVAVEAEFTTTAPTASMLNGGMFTFINNSSFNANRFTWDFGDGNADSTSYEPQHAYSSWGNYNVTLVAANELCSDTTYMSLTVTGMPGGAGNAGDMVGLSEQQIKDECEKGPGISVIVMPERLRITTEEQVNEPVSVMIFNLAGQQVLSQDFGNLETGNTEMDISSLRQGLYTYGVQTASRLLESGEFAR